MAGKISENEEKDFAEKLRVQMEAHFHPDFAPQVRRGWRGIEAVVRAPLIPVSRAEDIAKGNALLELQHSQMIKDLNARRLMSSEERWTRTLPPSQNK